MTTDDRLRRGLPFAALVLLYRDRFPLFTTQAISDHSARSVARVATVLGQAQRRGLVVRDSTRAVADACWRLTGTGVEFVREALARDQAAHVRDVARTAPLVSVNRVPARRK